MRLIISADIRQSHAFRMGQLYWLSPHAGSLGPSVRHRVRHSFKTISTGESAYARGHTPPKVSGNAPRGFGNAYDGVRRCADQSSQMSTPGQKLKTDCWAQGEEITCY